MPRDYKVTESNYFLISREMRFRSFCFNQTVYWV